MRGEKVSLEASGSGLHAELEATLISVMNHHRHDWMNDLQVLLGYIQLNKQEKLKAYLDKLLDKLYRESLVSKLGDDSLIAYLLIFRANHRSLALTVHPVKDINFSAFGKNGAYASEAIISVIEAYCLAASNGDGESNELLLSIDLIGDIETSCDLVIEFEYTGEYHPELLLQGAKAVIDHYQQGERSSASYDLLERSADIVFRQQLTGMDEVNEYVLR